MASQFATCLSCIDGRVQIPIINWIKENYNVDYVDMITDAGMDGILSSDQSNIDNIIKTAKLSIVKHKPKHIFVAGHFDCEGNPNDNETHKQQILQSVSKLKLLNMPCEIIGLWISEIWCVEKLVGGKP